MGFLTNEEKEYILGAGEKWDGKTVHDRSRDITKKCQSAFDDILWLLENMEFIRGVHDTEFRSKYGDPNKRWEGKGAPKRSTVTSEKLIDSKRVSKFLELYIKGSIDISYYKDWMKDEKCANGYRKRFKENVEKMKGDLTKVISQVKVEVG